MGYFGKPRRLDFREPRFVCFAVGAYFASYIEKECLYIPAALCEQPSYGKRVAPVVSRSGEYYYPSFFVEALSYDIAYAYSRTFHKVYGFYRLVGYRVLVELFKLAASEYLHCCKYSERRAQGQMKMQVLWVVACLLALAPIAVQPQPTEPQPVFLKYSERRAQRQPKMEIFG